MKNLMLLESRILLRSWFSYLFVFIALSMAFGLGAMFKDMAGLELGTGVKFNSSIGFAFLSVMHALLLSYFLVPIAVGGMFRERDNNAAGLLFSYPITATSLLVSRSLVLAIFSVALLTICQAIMLFSLLMPWQPSDALGDWHWLNYLKSFLWLALPGVFFTILISQIFAILFRSQLVVYLAIIVFFTLHGTIDVVATNMEIDWLVGLADYSGASDLLYSAQYWTTFEKSNEMWTLNTAMVLNRLFWCCLAAVGIYFIQKRFDLAYLSRKATKSKIDLTEAPMVEKPKIKLNRSIITSVIQQFISQFKIDLHLVLLKKSFVAYLVFAIVIVIIINALPSLIPMQVSIAYSDIIYDNIVNASALSVWIIILLYTGELIHFDNQKNIAALTRSINKLTLTQIFSKWLTMLAVIINFMLVMSVAGIAMQMYHGVYEITWSVYLFGMFVVFPMKFWLASGLFLSLQVLLINRWAAMVVSAMFIFGWAPLYDKWPEYVLMPPFATVPNMTFSAFNGWSLNAEGFWAYSLTWMLASVILLSLSSYLLKGIRSRWALAIVPACSILLVLMVLNNVSAEKRNGADYFAKDMERQQVDYELKYKTFATQPLLSLTHWQANIDLEPTKRSLTSSGVLTLINEQSVEITSLMLTWMGAKTVVDYEVSSPLIESIDHDENLGVQVVKFTRPILPGEKVDLDYDFNLSYQDYQLKYFDISVVENGTFMDSQTLKPHLGFNVDLQLKGWRAREKYGLESIQLRSSMDEELVRNTPAIGGLAPITTNIVVSTEIDQIAIMPGSLVKEWQQDNKAYFQYVMNTSMVDYSNLTSGRYIVKKDKWNHVDLSIYHLEGHDENIDDMMMAMKASLEYYSQEFSEYPLDYLRIVEFPRYRLMAQSFYGTIPFSEDMGFRADNTDENDFNFTFYVTAHEIAHQWWGHQLVAAKAKGEAFLIESLSEYSALKVVEKQFGPEQVAKILKYNQDLYLQSRGLQEFSDPLISASYIDGSHVYYQKGSILMTSIAKLIGESELNGALSDLLSEQASKAAPFSLATDVEKAISDATPTENKKLVWRLLNNEISHDNQIVDASYELLANGQYQVDAVVQSAMTYIGRGGEHPLKINYPIEIALLHEKMDKGLAQSIIEKQELTIKPKAVGLENKLEDNKYRVSFVVDEKPTYVAIDPSYLYIDKDLKNNYKKISEK